MVNYRIILRDKDGAYVDELTDYISLSITDVANNVGSWKITSRTKNRHPFRPGYGIVVFREGTYLYSGIMEEVSANYNPDGSWSWTASGKNDLQLLSYRVITPQFTSSEVLIGQYDTYSYTLPLHVIIYSLIHRNASYQADALREGAMPIVGDLITEQPFTSKSPVGSKSYRCDPLLQTVIDLANEGNYYIRATWDETEHKIIYVLTDGRDLSSYVIFSDKREDVAAAHHILRAPEYTTVVWNYHSEAQSFSSDTPIWKFMIFSNLPDPNGNGADRLVAKWYSNEDVQSPDGHYFGGDYSHANLILLNQAYYESRPKMYYEGFDLEFQTSETAPMYQLDYKLGDIVGIQFGEKSGTGRVTKVEISFSAGNETVKPTIDAFLTGSIDSFKANVARLGQSVTQMKNREV